MLNTCLNFSVSALTESSTVTPTPQEFDDKNLSGNNILGNANLLNNKENTSLSTDNSSSNASYSDNLETKENTSLSTDNSSSNASYSDNLETKENTSLSTDSSNSNTNYPADLETKRINTIPKVSSVLSDDPTNWSATDGDNFLKDWNYSVWNGSRGGRYFLLESYKGNNPNLVIPGFLKTSHRGNLSVVLKGIGKSSPYYFLQNTDMSIFKSIRFVEVNNIKVGVITGQPNADRMFEGATNLQTADLSGLMFSNVPNGNFSGISNFSYMFNNCKSLTSVELPPCNTATNCSYMFSGCSNLANINLNDQKLIDFGNFDTSNVTDMSYMFYQTKIAYIPRNIKYNNVTNLSHMFDGCSQVKWMVDNQNNASKAVDMSYMFANCRSLDAIPFISSSSATNLSHMFDGCSLLRYLVASSAYFTGNIQDMSYMFNNCLSLNDVTLKNFNTSNVTNMSSMFNGCSSLTEVSDISTSNVTDMSSMFNGCSSLTNPNLSTFNTTKVTNMSSMFNGCSSLSNNFVSGGNMINTSNVTNMSYMFANCTSLTDITPKFNTNKVTNMDHMFYACSKLVTADFSNFNTSNVTNMSYMFGGNYALENINLKSFSTSKVTNMAYMFGKTNSLRYIDLSNFNISNNVLLTTLFFTENKTPLLVIVDKNRSSKLFSYNYSGDNRIPVVYPQLDANGGFFNKQSSTLSYFNNIVYDQTDSKLQLNTLESWKNNNIPTKSNTAFVRWHSSNNSTTLEQMVKNSTVYKAEWILNPNTAAENTKNVSLNTLAIVYFPTRFTTGQNQIILNDKGQQVIPFSKGNLTSIGIRDQRMSRSNWKLNAHMSWNGEGPNGGGYIKLGENATVKQNNNNGIAPFNSISDLVSTSQPTVGSRIINSNDSTIMSNNSSILDGVYECNLGDISLVLSEVSQVAVGNYSAKVTWNLILAPS